VDDEPESFPAFLDALIHARRKTGDLLSFRCVEGHLTEISMDELVGKHAFICTTCQKPYPLHPDDRRY
jgi:hypothetical protein